MKLALNVYHPSLDWATIDVETIETDDYDYFVFENRGTSVDWYLIGYKWRWLDELEKKGDGGWKTKEWDIQSTHQAVKIYQKIPDKINSVRGYNHYNTTVTMFIKELLGTAKKGASDNRLGIRAHIQKSGNGIYKSLSFCKPLQYIAGELMAQNEEYVLNHQGKDETIGATNILKNGFTDNQIIFLKDLEKIIKTTDYR